MKYIYHLAALMAFIGTINAKAQRNVETLKNGWEFSKGESFNHQTSQTVTIPHDWAIYGPFDRKHDLQVVAVEQNGETEATEKTGRTGGLPFIGRGVYRTSFEVPDTTGKTITLVFDGVMSNAKVKLNGKEVKEWPYGYNSFYVNVDGTIMPGINHLEVSCENKEGQSRWYPGAGIYRNVHVVTTGKVHIPTWGTYVTTPEVNKDYAFVNLRMKIEGAKQFEKWPYGELVGVRTVILAPDGKEVASDTVTFVTRGQELAQSFVVDKPMLWDTRTPSLYTARTTLSVKGKPVDVYDTRFGIRKIGYIPNKGFFLNGKSTKFKGVCNHHDLGPLGAAVNKSALRYQIELLKEIGVNAIRTSHNMPAPELAELCDEMGVMLMVEPFDDWGFRPKSPNGYGSIFNEWAERDITNMVEQYRNHPSVVMWSIGNEVPSQWGEPGIKELVMLQDLVHRLDPTRPVTCGMDQAVAVLDNGFAAALDIPGFNYKPHFYKKAYEMLPQKLVLGAETASTVSSRGVYEFPLVVDDTQIHLDHHSSSYDSEFCFWSNIPDLDFAADEDYPWCIGQFVWTGFDYLGEPSPYDTNAWPNHSSLFGIYDLAFLPKDRAYLYRSLWREDDATLHMLPHWNWKGLEGQVTPVMVYTSWPKAELFVNGVSQGVRTKAVGKDIILTDKLDANHYPDKSTRSSMDRYRMIWDDVVYQPGEIKVVAYDNDGHKVDEKIVRTAGKPHHLVLTPNRSELDANGEDLLYVTVRVADKDGNIVPTENRLVKFLVDGAGTFEATANGDVTCLLPFHKPEMKLFSGAATAIARSGNVPGTLRLTAIAKGLQSAEVKIKVK